LRADSNARRSITRSFRAVPELLAFVNDLCGEMGSDAKRPDDFKYDTGDRFPVVTGTVIPPTLGISVGPDPETCAAAVAREIARILEEDSVRDRETGVMRRATPGDIGILFRSRASHREFEAALSEQGIPTYVYKGLGFFDAD